MPPELPPGEDMARGAVRWAIYGAVAGLLVFVVALFIDKFSVSWAEGLFLGAAIGAGVYLVSILAIALFEWAF